MVQLAWWVSLVWLLGLPLVQYGMESILGIPLEFQVGTYKCSLV